MANTITVFSDYETYEGADGIVAIVTDKGMNEMSDNETSYRRLNETEILSEVSIRSLLDLWNKTHGTKF